MSVTDLREQLSERVDLAVFGMESVTELVTIALVVRGHILLEGYPGLGKTLLAHAIALALGRRFGRIQCTADLMPSDMTGIHIYNEQSREFELMPGPLFSDVVLVDEINRTGPKTQSAMLQAMEERSISIDRESYALAEEFLVIATQNPYEFEGTYPLPESQIDRFLMKVSIGYPQVESEIEVLRAYDHPGSGHGERLQAITPIDPGVLESAREATGQVRVSDQIYRYAGDIAATSREHPHIALGISTRGVLALMQCARVVAALDGLAYVTPDHVKEVAPPVLSHRLVLSQDAMLEGIEVASVTNDLLDRVEVPRT